MRRKTGVVLRPRSLGGHGCAEKDKKGGMLQVDQIARRRSWAILALDFFKKEASEQKAAIFNQEGPPGRPLASRLALHP